MQNEQTKMFFTNTFLERFITNTNSRVDTINEILKLDSNSIEKEDSK